MRDAEVASCGLTLRRAGGGRNVKRAEQTGAEQFGCTPLLKRRANEVKSTLKSGMREFAGESLLRLVSNISVFGGRHEAAARVRIYGPSFNIAANRHRHRHRHAAVTDAVAPDSRRRDATRWQAACALLSTSHSTCARDRHCDGNAAMEMEWRSLSLL